MLIRIGSPLALGRRFKYWGKVVTMDGVVFALRVDSVVLALKVGLRHKPFEDGLDPDPPMGTGQ